MILQVKERIEVIGSYKIKLLWPESVISFSEVTVTLNPGHKYSCCYNDLVNDWNSDSITIWIDLLDEEDNESVRVKLQKDKISLITDAEEQETILGPSTGEWPDPRYNRPELRHKRN